MSPDHACWTDEESARKVRKNRFGSVKMAEVVGLGNMLRMHEAEAERWVGGKMRERDPPEEDEMDDDEFESRAIVLKEEMEMLERKRRESLTVVIDE